MAIAIVLNGPSSSGKTTIARALQERASQLFLYFSIDAILASLPRSAFDRIASGEDISDLRYPELVRAYFACVRQLLGLERDVVIDFPVTADSHIELLHEATRGHFVLAVRLECAADVLRERERVRGDRAIGLAERQRAALRDEPPASVIIDTATTSPHDAASQIIAALARMIPPERSSL